jgi:hypothetical protein
MCCWKAMLSTSCSRAAVDTLQQGAVVTLQQPQLTRCSRTAVVALQLMRRSYSVAIGTGLELLLFRTGTETRQEMQGASCGKAASDVLLEGTANDVKQQSGADVLCPDCH